MKQASAFLALLGLSACLAVSCNQADDPVPTPDPDPITLTNCRITALQSISGSSTTNGTFTYDSDKRVTAYEETGSSPNKKTFVYYSGYILGIQYNAGVASHRDTIRLNSAGCVTEYVYVELPADTVEQRSLYEYNGSNQLVKVTHDRVGQATPFIAAYEYNSDGNMTKETQSGGSLNSVTTYGYYTDKTVRSGDLYGLQDILIFGSGKLRKNAHLIKSETRSGNVTNYAYEFDSGGRITKVTLTPQGAASQNVILTQACN